MDFANILINSENDYYGKTLLFNIFVIFNVLMLMSQQFSVVVLLTFALSLYIISVYVSYYDKKKFNKNEEIMEKFIKIQNTLNNTNTSLTKDYKNSTEVENVSSHLYVDSTMIEFVYSILWLHKYNQQLFYKYMMGVNNILKFRAENEEYYARNKKPHPDFNDMVKASIEMKFNTIENLKSFIHVIPRTKEFTLSLNDIVLHHHKMMNKNLYLLEKINWKR